MQIIDYIVDVKKAWVRDDSHLPGEHVGEDFYFHEA